MTNPNTPAGQLARSMTVEEFMAYLTDDQMKDLIRGFDEQQRTADGCSPALARDNALLGEATRQALKQLTGEEV